MTVFRDKNILITGGASGIGLLVAHRVKAHGAKNILLWDINEEALEKAKSEVGEGAHTQVVDVRNLARMKEAHAEFKKDHGGIDILFNNAGVVVGKKFIDHSHEDIDFTMGINSTALMHLGLLCLKDMKEKGQGHLVNLASAAGMVSNPGMSVYCASKWAVIGWSDSLRLELEATYPQIKVTTVCPYYISTGMFDGVNSPILPILKPDFVVKKILKAVQKNMIFVRMPFLINLLPLIKGIMPVRVFDFVAGRIFGIYKGMETFKGRKP